MSKEWEVTLPAIGVVYVTVQAETEEEAIETALRSYEPSDLEHWEAVSAVVRGNVCYASPSRASAELVGGSHDD